MKKELTAWDRVEIARNPKRKTSIEYIENIFDDFIELHGDRISKDDFTSLISIMHELGLLDKYAYREECVDKGTETEIRKVFYYDKGRARFY